MATQFELDCALMAGGAYISNRPNNNQFPIPSGWDLIPQSHFSDPATGSEAVAFSRSGNQSDIVISFAGTDGFWSVDQFANIPLANGEWAQQLGQAADYYLALKASSNSGANITFTGHSLGGGLAALMGVFFGKQAVTFDQAPFAESAQSVSAVASQLRQYLLNKTLMPPVQVLARDELVTALNGFITARASSGGIPNTNLVTGYRVQGEFLSSTPPFNALSPIGTEGPPIGHGDYFGPFDLHSQALLTAFLQSDDFRKVTSKLPDLLTMVFSEGLFAYKTNDDSNTNLLEHLLRHEFGNAPGVAAADAMLTRFTTDLQAIAQDGGLSLTETKISDMLIAFAMQMYYANDQASGSDKQLFSDATGGLYFDRTDVAASLGKAKGYSYLLSYLQGYSGDELQSLMPLLPKAIDWTIQAGSGSLSVAAGSKAAFTKQRGHPLAPLSIGPNKNLRRQAH